VLALPCISPVPWAKVTHSLWVTALTADAGSFSGRWRGPTRAQPADAYASLARPVGPVASPLQLPRFLPGQTPVQALTNANGVAIFTISSSYPSSEPVYFEANLVNSRSFYPYGYSPILAVRFRS